MKYGINKEFGFFGKFKPPLNAPVFRLALAMPKGLRSTNAVSVEKYKIPVRDGKKLPLYVFSPKNSRGKQPAVLYFHGGGFVFKGAPHHYKLVKSYAEKANVKVVYADYRLSFQGAYLTPLSDCVEAYRFVSENADEMNIDIGNIGLAGDSAGGYLALAVTKSLFRNGFALPKYQLLVYPAADPDMTTDSMQRFRDTPMWNGKANAKMWKLYSHGNRVYNPLLDDLSFMPPTYIEVAEFDCLRDEGIALYEKLVSYGKACTLFATTGTMHGFDIRLSAPTTQKAIERRASALKEFINL